MIEKKEKTQQVNSAERLLSLQAYAFSACFVCVDETEASKFLLSKNGSRKCGSCLLPALQTPSSDQTQGRHGRTMVIHLCSHAERQNLRRNTIKKRISSLDLVVLRLFS